MNYRIVEVGDKSVETLSHSDSQSEEPNNLSYSYCKMKHDCLLLNIAQAGLELMMILLPEPTECSAYRCGPPCLSTEFIFCI